MSAEDDFTDSLRALIQSMIPVAGIQRGPITSVMMAEAGYIVTVDLGYPLTVQGQGLMGAFLTQLDMRRETGSLNALIGRTVEVHFSAGQQAAIADTVGV